MKVFLIWSHFVFTLHSSFEIKITIDYRFLDCKFRHFCLALSIERFNETLNDISSPFRYLYIFAFRNDSYLITVGFHERFYLNHKVVTSPFLIPILCDHYSPRSFSCDTGHSTTINTTCLTVAKLATTTTHYHHREHISVLMLP